MYRRILVPIDGSATAERGFQEALGLAKALRAGLVLLHVVEIFPLMRDMANSSAWEQVSSDMHAEGQRLLDSAHQRATAAGVASQAHLEDSTAARACDVIVEQAGRRQCDLIVMGTHGRRGVAHALIGSDAERVLRLAAVPVLLVRAAHET